MLFPPLGIVLVGMLGIGLAEKTGFLPALLDFVTSKIHQRMLTPLTILLGILLGIDFPARNAYFPKIIPEKYLRSGISLNGATMAGSSVVVPTIGGFLIAEYGSFIGILLSAIGYLVMSISTFFIPSVSIPKDNSSNLSFFTEGFSFVVKNELFYCLILLTYCTNFFILI